MKRIKNNPVTAYYLTIGFALLGVMNIIHLVFYLFNNTFYSYLFELFSISWTYFPYLLIEILDNEFSLLTIFMYLFITLMIFAYVALPVFALKKRSKNINGVLAVILFFDILFTFPILFSEPVIGLINISIKAFLMFLCLKNIKWYNENYDNYKIV